MTGFAAKGARVSRGPSETEALGAELAERLQPGQVVLIEGELGAGKTTFVRGACRALGVAGPVRSPTFTIGHRYSGTVAVTHIDLFRVADLRGEEPDFLSEYFGPTTIAFVEWPPREPDVAILGQVAARVCIAHAGGDQRRVEIRMTDDWRLRNTPGDANANRAHR